MSRERRWTVLKTWSIGSISDSIGLDGTLSNRFSRTPPNTFSRTKTPAANLVALLSMAMRRIAVGSRKNPISDLLGPFSS
jgi:hypothetical protein